MGERKQSGGKHAAGGGQSSRANRPWKDETNPTRDRDDATQTEPEQTLSTGSPDPGDPTTAPRRAHAGRPDQGGTWQTGPGSAGATESSGRQKEHEGQSDQAGPRR